MKRRWNICCLLLAAFLASGTLVQCSEGGHQTPPPLASGDQEEEEQPDGQPGYPKGLTVEAFADDLSGGAKCLGYYAVVDFKANPRLRFRPQQAAAKTPTAYFSSFAASGGGTPYVVVNGGFFNGSLQSVSLLMEAGAVKSIAIQDDYIWSTTPYTHFFPVRAALGQLPDGSFEATWVYCVADDANRPYTFPSALNNNEKTMTFMATAPTSHTAGGRRWSPDYAIGAGPMLVYGGKNVAEENYWKEIFDCGGLAGLTRQPRTALGVTADGKLVVLVCDGRQKRGSAGFTLPEMAEKLIALGCVQGVNLDGGGSSTFVGKDGTVLNMPSDTPGTTLEGATIKQRSIPTAVVIAEE